MSEADGSPGRDEPGRDDPGRDEPGRPPERPILSGRRSRALIVGTVLGVAVFLIAFMLLVSQCGTGDDSEIYGRAGHPSAAIVQVQVQATV